LSLDPSPELALDAILSGFLSGFQIVVVQLGQEDDAQAIFASLNGNAQPLTSFDLIRNDIFHRARKANEDDDALYNNYWNDLETDFWKKEVKQGRLKRPRTHHLITHALVAETGQDINVGQVSNEYRRFSEKRAFESVAEEVKSLLRYARAYEEMERRQKGQALAQVASFLDVWDMSAFHPIVLWTSVQDIAQEDKDAIYAFIESYLIRRDICDLTNKNYNKVVPALLRDIHIASDARAAFFKHTTELAGDVSRIPVDAEVVTSIVKKPLYQQLGSRKLRYVFSKIEQHLRSKYDEKVVVAVDDLTVEHIMPSVWAKNWPLQSGATVGSENYFSLTALGIEVGEVVRREMEVREAAKHTLGNLTMLTYSLNPALGNSGWLYKKGLIAKSLLVINRSIAEHDDWNEDTIEARGVKLASTINEIWPYPDEFKKVG